jgi:hypothetical protein
MSAHQCVQRGFHVLLEETIQQLPIRQARAVGTEHDLAQVVEYLVHALGRH